MAIEKDFESTDTGAHISGAYIKIGYISWSDVNKKLMVHVSVWATPTAQEEGKQCLGTYDLEITHLFDDLRGDIYEHLKTLPEFADGKDV